MDPSCQRARCTSKPKERQQASDPDSDDDVLEMFWASAPVLHLLGDVRHRAPKSEKYCKQAHKGHTSKVKRHTRKQSRSGRLHLTAHLFKPWLLAQSRRCPRHRSEHAHRGVLNVFCADPCPFVLCVSFDPEDLRRHFKLYVRQHAACLPSDLCGMRSEFIQSCVC